MEELYSPYDGGKLIPVGGNLYKSESSDFYCTLFNGKLVSLVDPHDGGRLIPVSENLYKSKYSGFYCTLFNGKLISLVDPMTAGKLIPTADGRLYSEIINKYFVLNEGKIIPLSLLDIADSYNGEEAKLVGDTLVGVNTGTKVLLSDRGELLSAPRMYIDYINHYLLKNRLYWIDKKQYEDDIQSRGVEYANFMKKTKETVNKGIDNITEEDLRFMINNVFDFLSEEEKNNVFNLFKSKLNNNPKEYKPADEEMIPLYDKIESILNSGNITYGILQSKPISSDYHENVYNIALSVKQNGIENMTYTDFKYLSDTLDKESLLKKLVCDEKDFAIADLILNHLKEKEKSKQI